MHKNHASQPSCFAAYLRVSTERQGQSGLGIEAQRAAVRDYVNQNGIEVVREFHEIESGRKSGRTELIHALDFCRKQRATLLIAKLDRLARNVHFLSGLMEAGVEFIALDMPQADRFMLHIYAAIAEEEARSISQRTKAALSAARERGVRLGANASTLARRHRAAADAFALQLGPELVLLQTKGASIRSICQQLNDQKTTTATGGIWHPTTVARTLERFRRLADP